MIYTRLWTRAGRSSQCAKIAAAGSGREGNCESQRKYRAAPRASRRARAAAAPRSAPARTSPRRTGTERQVHPRHHQGALGQSARYARRDRGVLMSHGALCDEPRCLQAARVCELIAQTSGDPVYGQRVGGRRRDTGSRRRRHDNDVSRQSVPRSGVAQKRTS
jgi:hypothetical protein